MSQCTKFQDNVTCSFREIKVNIKCDGRTNEQTEKLYTPQLLLAGYKNMGSLFILLHTVILKFSEFYIGLIGKMTPKPLQNGIIAKLYITLFSKCQKISFVMNANIF